MRRVSAVTNRPQRWLWDAAVYLLAAGFFVIPRGGVWENDLFFHIAFGQWMLDGGASTGNPDWIFGPYGNDAWINTLTISEIIFALVYQVGGWTAVGLIRDLAIPALLLTIYFSLTRFVPRSSHGTPNPDPHRLAFFAAPIITFAVAGAMTVRPQTWSYVLLPLLLAVALHVLRTGSVPLPALAIVGTWLWSCWHGYGMLVAPVLAAALGAHHLAAVLAGSGPAGARIFAAIKQSARTALVIVATAVVPLLTPAGTGLWTSAATIREAARGVISEWEPVDFASTLGIILISALVLYAASALLDLKRSGPRNFTVRAELAAEAIFTIVVFVSFTAVMRTAIVALILVAMLAAHRAITAVTRPGAKVEIAPLEQVPAHRWTAVQAIAIAAAMSASAIIYPIVSTPGVNENYQPMRIINAIVNEPGERRVFISYDSASALMFAAQQADAAVKVSLDSRVDKFGYDVIKRHLSLDVKFDGESWAPYASATDAVLFAHSALAKELIARGWTVRDRIAGLTPDSEAIEWLWLTPQR